MRFGKRFSCLPILAALVLAVPALARADEPSSQLGERQLHSHAGAGSTPRAAREDKIVGHCSLAVGPDNPISGPCSNTMVILSDAKGNDVEDTRTTSTGDFEFSGLKGKPSPFKIRSGSRFYEVQSPSGSFPSGVELDLKLKQK